MSKIKTVKDLFLDKSQKGIWQFSSLLSFIDDQYKLSLGEGNTQERILDEIILKREDQNPSGSWKDRGMAYLVSLAYSKGAKELALPSSGNAAISAGAYCELARLNLTVFVSFNIEEEKMAKLSRSRARVKRSLRPISDCVRYIKENHAFDLRQSRNQFGPEGYQTIAFELFLDHGRVDDLFLPVSSGVALIGISEGFKKLGFLPKIHLCQSSSVYPLAGIFDKNFKKEEKSLARALVAKFSPLRSSILRLVKESGGTGWVIENGQILKAQEILMRTNILTSNEGALSLAAVYKAKDNGWNLGKTVCLLTGKKY